MGPFKCPDCGVWWAGFEHRCAPATTGTAAWPPNVPTWPYPGTNSISTGCRCPRDSLGNRACGSNVACPCVTCHASVLYEITGSTVSSYRMD